METANPAAGTLHQPRTTRRSVIPAGKMQAESVYLAKPGKTCGRVFFADDSSCTSSSEGLNCQITPVPTGTAIGFCLSKKLTLTAFFLAGFSCACNAARRLQCRIAAIKDAAWIHCEDQRPANVASRSSSTPLPPTSSAATSCTWTGDLSPCKPLIAAAFLLQI